LKLLLAVCCLPNAKDQRAGEAGSDASFLLGMLFIMEHGVVIAGIIYCHMPHVKTKVITLNYCEMSQNGN